MNAPELPTSDVSESSAAASLWLQFRTTPWLDLLHGRLSGRLDVAAIVAASELPDAARKRILGIVEGTCLSRSEKVDVAGELIAHFADGLDAGASLDDLLESFGDIPTTAKLIRRAKLRCRPWIGGCTMSKSNAYLLLFGSFGWFLGFAWLARYAASVLGATSEDLSGQLLFLVWLLVFASLFVTGSALWAGAKGYKPAVGAVLGFPCNPVGLMAIMLLPDKSLASDKHESDMPRALKVFAWSSLVAGAVLIINKVVSIIAEVVA
jgi:hypothetical protein